MHLELNKIASISSGQTFRGRVENNEHGTVQVIQMKDLSNAYSTILNTAHLVKEDEVNSNQLLKRGDILFMAKGNNNKALVYDRDEAAVAVSLFFVIRPNRDKITPHYLAWFINKTSTQNFFKSERAGATVSNIKKGTIEDLKITIPDFKTQDLIAKIYSLSIKEEEILNQVIEEKRSLIQSSLNKVIS